VRERRHGPGFPFEACGICVAAEKLDRDLAPELRVVCQPDLGHRACAEPFLEAITAADRLVHRGSSLWAKWLRHREP